MRARLAIAVALLLVGLVASGFVIVPGPKATRQCANLAYCYGVDGPWVIVPAHGEATYLFGCPARSQEKGAFLLGGTDARVSSKHIHVWYEGKLGAPIAKQTPGTTGLLFHASSDDGKQGSFQPVVGCISLRQAIKRSTLSAKGSGPPVGKSTLSSPLPTFRTSSLVLEPGWRRTQSVSCRKGETLVGGWSAIAFGTSGPPVGYHDGAVTLRNALAGRTARTAIVTSASVPYLIRVQVGAMCEP